MSVNFIPAGYHTATPYMIVKGAAQAIDFYKSVFGATEVMRYAGPGGTVMHAELKIGNSIVMIGEEMGEMGFKSPETLGGSPVGICIYVPNVDELFAAALAAGATVKKPVEDQFYGDRSGSIVDPYGHNWTIATHTEDVAPDEMMRRFEAELKKWAA